MLLKNKKIRQFLILWSLAKQSPNSSEMIHEEAAFNFFMYPFKVANAMAKMHIASSPSLNIYSGASLEIENQQLQIFSKELLCSLKNRIHKAAFCNASSSQFGSFGLSQ